MMNRLSLQCLCTALFLWQQASCWSSAPTPSRREVFQSGFLALICSPATAANAFDGSGSSLYSGKNPASKAALAKSYRDRIAADVKDFGALGKAIQNGNTDGDEWIGFFIQYPRREPDAIGRTYAARVDLVGLDPKSTGGSALLLAGTYAKPNKPPDNLPQFKAYTKLAKALDPIKAAGKAGDAAKAQKEWDKASALLQEYLASVELPESLTDPLYQ